MPSPESPANRTTTRSIFSVVSPLPAMARVLLSAVDAHWHRVPTLAPLPEWLAEPDETTLPRHPGGDRRASLLGDSYRSVEVHVLDGVDQCSTLISRTLEGLATDNETLATGPLIDHRHADGLRQVTLTL